MVNNLLDYVNAGQRMRDIEKQTTEIKLLNGRFADIEVLNIEYLGLSNARRAYLKTLLNGGNNETSII